MPLGNQSILWASGYIVLGLMIVACGVVAWWINHNDQAELPVQNAALAVSPTWRRRSEWIGLAMVPSGLLVAVTAFITTDLVAAPFLWVIPLALFLGTFIITFAREPVISHKASLKLHAWLVAPAMLVMFSQFTGIYMLPIHLAAFFISAMVCHGELVKRRPDASHLTEFYLWMSFGGVVGGFFASIIAPNIFSTVLEYPILMMAVFICRKDFWVALRTGKPDQFWSFLVLATLFAASFSGIARLAAENVILPAAVLLVAGVVILRHQTVTQLGLVASGVALMLLFGINQFSVQTIRSFFGVNTVVAYESGTYNLLLHGTTLHGAEKRKDHLGRAITARPVPLTYYYNEGPLAVAIDRLRDANGGSLGQVALVGLGTGAMACHRQKGENWRYFEIDPEVVKIARDPNNFRFLSHCGESDGIVLGDGRVTLEKENDGKFDVIVLDAFSSDSIPIHLMTREAMKLYFRKLNPNGALVFHISNRYMELASIVTATAATQGGLTYINKLDDTLWNADKNKFKMPALVAVVGRNSDDLGALATGNRWFQLRKDQYSTPWTDDYSNILGAIFRAYTSGVIPAEHRSE